jgi:hypothetical protein
VTITLNLFKEIAEIVKPPRTLHLRFPYGSPVGKPNDEVQQRKVLLQALKVIETETTPGIIVHSDLKYR